MSQSQIDILQRALKREKTARKAAENILEEKSKELFYLSIELKKANTKLADLLNEKTSQLQGVFATFLDAYIVINLKGYVIKMNDAAKDIFGYDNEKETILVKNLIQEEDKEYAFDSFLELTQKGFFYNYTTRVLTKTKKIKWVQINASIIYDVNKNPIAAQGIIRDITKDKEDANLLIESKNRLTSLIANLDSGVLLEDENNKIVLTNTKFCEFFKIPTAPELLIGYDCFNAAQDCKHLFKDPENFTLRIQELLNNKKEVLGEEVLMADGTVLERDFIPILKDNVYNGNLWTYKDVSLNRKYRKSLEAQKNKYSNIIANMNIGLVEVSIAGDILFANQTICEMSGYNVNEITGKRIDKLLPYTGTLKIIESQKKKRFKGESSSYEIQVQTKKKQKKHWLISGAPNYNLKGELTGTIAICLDISSSKTLEKQKNKILKELEDRNYELEQYAHIVSHDLKSPLRSIHALSSWIRSDNEGKFNELTLQNFDLLDNTLEKMEQLISDILIYSSAGIKIKETQEINLQLLVEELIKTMYVPKNITINIENPLPVLYGDRTKFLQLFQNLISNAVKFSDKEDGFIEINVINIKNFYQFSVKDNGIGIDKKYHKKIFEIFHSLHENKSSTGIGLSIVKKIIELYEGQIWIESTPNQGTSFYFTLKKQHGKT